MMASVGEAIYSILAADVTVNGLVGTKIYPQVAPQSAALPMVVYEREESETYPVMGGTAGKQQTWWTVWNHAATYAGANALASAVHSALVNHEGVIAGLYIDVIYMESMTDAQYEPELNEYCAEVRVRIWSNEEDT